MDDGDGANPAFRLEQGHPSATGRKPARLQPQEGRDGLQVVLDPVVHLPDGRVLGQQEPVEPADVGHVAQKDQTAGHLPVGQEGDAVDQHGHIGPPLHLLDHGKGRGQGPLDGRLLDTQIGEAAPFDLGVHAHPVQGVGGVGRGVAHLALLVHQHDAVAHPRGLLGGHLFAREGEGRLGHHGGQALEQVAIGPFEMAGPPPRPGRQPGQHGHQRRPSQRTGMQCMRHRLVTRVELDLPPGHLARLEGENGLGPAFRRRRSVRPGRAGPRWRCWTGASVRGRPG